MILRSSMYLLLFAGLLVLLGVADSAASPRASVQSGVKPATTAVTPVARDYRGVDTRLLAR